ncbi:MAG: PIN domain-containing protein [Deltaproteobacteria bacterium]|nr:PIN domain-containing protein [Deltaproteobacteria bacterium]
MTPKAPLRVTSGRQKVVALDTNIFIHHFEENPVYIAFTGKLFDWIESGRVRAVTSTLTLHEILSGARKGGRPALVQAYRDLLLSFPNLEFMPFTVELTDLSSDLRARYGLRTPDAIQIATAIRGGAESFISNDESLLRVREIRVKLPERAG